MSSNLRTLFDRVVAITKEDRQDRWEEFRWRLPASWPFLPPLRVPAISGESIPQPTWWKEPPTAWGCLLSHRQSIQDALQSGLDSILILEEEMDGDTHAVLSSLPNGSPVARECSIRCR